MTPDSAYGNKVSTQTVEPSKHEDAASNDQQSVVNAVNKWANAWSSKNVEAYLDAYDASFKTPDGESRKAWESTRRERINKPGKIEVSVSKILQKLIMNISRKSKVQENANSLSSILREIYYQNYNPT